MSENVRGVLNFLSHNTDPIRYQDHPQFFFGNDISNQNRLALVTNGKNGNSRKPPLNALHRAFVSPFSLGVHSSFNLQCSLKSHSRSRWYSTALLVEMLQRNITKPLQSCIVRRRPLLTRSWWLLSSRRDSVRCRDARSTRWVSRVRHDLHLLPPRLGQHSS